VAALRSSGALAGLSAPGGAPLPEAAYMQQHTAAPLTSNGLVALKPALLGGPPPGGGPGLGPGPRPSALPGMHPAVVAVRAAQASALSRAQSGSPRSPQDGLLPGLGPGGLPGQGAGAAPRMLPGAHLAGGGPPGAGPYGQGMLAGLPPGAPPGAPLPPQPLRMWQDGAPPAGAPGGAAAMAPGVSVSELKRLIEGLPLESSAVAAVAPRLARLDAAHFAALLTELARDNHAFRAWQLFDWLRTLPEGAELRALADVHTYTTMISLCGLWQQLPRAMQLVAEMRARSDEAGVQGFTALLHAAVKCGETELAIDLYAQMGREGLPRDRASYALLVDAYVKAGRVKDALGVLGDMRAADIPPDTQLYNLALVAATKAGPPRAALEVYQQMVADGAAPNTKTFTALIGAFGKLGSVGAALDVIHELLAPGGGGAVDAGPTYASLMAACEKAGQWDLAVALFDTMSARGCVPDVTIFNSMIAACAHGGEFVKARLMFERMAEHGCAPDAVTFANMIRAYKKGGQVRRRVGDTLPVCAGLGIGYTLPTTSAGRGRRAASRALAYVCTAVFQCALGTCSLGVHGGGWTPDLRAEGRGTGVALTAPAGGARAVVRGAGHVRGDAGERLPAARGRLLVYHRRALADRHRVGAGQGAAAFLRRRAVRPAYIPTLPYPMLRGALRPPPLAAGAVRAGEPMALVGAPPGFHTPLGALCARTLDS